MNPHDTQRRELLLGVAAALATPAALAQSDKVIRFILPNATGSGVDAITRTAQPALAKALGHAIVVDNQPGAGGIVGLQALARSPADGFALSVVSNNVVIFPSVYKTLPFDMPNDFTPIAVVGYTPVVLVVNAKVPANNAKELIALLESRGGELNYASGGNGTILHLASAMFLDETGTKARHIPYKGVVRRLRQLRPRRVDLARSGDGERDQPQLSRSLRAGQRVAGEPGHGGGKRHHRAAGVVRRAGRRSR